MAEETTEEREQEETTEEGTAETPTTTITTTKDDEKKPVNVNAVKVVISSQDGKKFMIGIQVGGCDPVLSQAAGEDIEAAAMQIPAAVAGARSQWQQSQTHQYPAHIPPKEERKELPAQPKKTSAPLRGTQRVSRGGTKSTPAGQTVKQTDMFD